MSFTNPDRYQEFWDTHPEVPYKDPQLDSVITQQDGQNYINVLGSFAPPPPAVGAATEAKQDVQIAQITAAQDGTTPLYVKDGTIADQITGAQDGTAPFYVTSAGGAVATAALQTTSNGYLTSIATNSVAISTNTSNIATNTSNALSKSLKQVTVGAGLTTTIPNNSLVLFAYTITGVRVDYDLSSGYSMTAATNLELALFKTLTKEGLLEFSQSQSNSISTLLYSSGSRTLTNNNGLAISVLYIS